MFVNFTTQSGPQFVFVKYSFPLFNRSKMAAPMESTAAGMHESQDETNVSKLEMKDVQNFNFILDNVIGEKKHRSRVMMPLGTFPQMAKSKEEIIISRAFESCTFKSVASCVIGKELRNGQINKDY